MKMLITLESHSVFWSNFAYLYILIFSSHWNAKRWRGITEHPSGRPWSVSEKALISWIAWYISIKFCILIHLNIVYGMQNGDEASPSFSLAGRCQFVKMFITLEPHGMLWSNFAYEHILILSSHWYQKRGRGIASFTINSGEALTVTLCSSIYMPKLSTVPV